MKSMLVVMPILPGKLDQWKSMQALAEDSAISELAAKGGVDRVRFWHFQTPDGSDMAVVLHEGSDPDKWLPTVMESNHPIAEKFRSMAAEVHGLTADAMKNAPPPPTLTGDVTLT